LKGGVEFEVEYTEKEIIIKKIIAFGDF